MKSHFSQLGISEDVVKAIEDIGWEEPTPIQTEAVPYGIEGRDLLAQAQTGTGKTGTYGSIILSSIEAKNAWPQALVLVPTRELALQVSEELKRLSEYSGHRNVPVYGGVSMLKQTQAMDKGVDIIIATPGRLCDHLKDDERLLDDVSIVVLDEADRMLDMGFRKDMEFILERIPTEGRQTMLFSATMSNDIKKLAMRHLDDPKEICVSKDELVLDAIDQRYMMVEKDEKMDMLRYILAKDPMKTLVFCFTKYRVDKVVRKLKMSFKLAGIHGEYSQNRREETLRKFKSGEIEVLIASDLAARGLDIEGVDRIINFDMPPEAETYVHRIGRTGRAGNTGLALSFVMREDRKLLKEIENLTLSDLQEIERPSKDDMDAVFRGIKELSSPVMAKKNSRKNDVPVKDKVYIVAEINIGKADGQGKATISQLIKEHTTVPKKSIGNIYVGDKTSTLEVEKKYFSKTESGLSRCSVNGKSVKMWKVSEVEEPITDTLEEPDEETVRKAIESSEKERRDNRSESGGNFDRTNRQYRNKSSYRRSDGYRRNDEGRHDNKSFKGRERGRTDSSNRGKEQYRNKDRRDSYRSDRKDEGRELREGPRNRDRPYRSHSNDRDGPSYRKEGRRNDYDHNDRGYKGRSYNDRDGRRDDNNDRPRRQFQKKRRQY